MALDYQWTDEQYAGSRHTGEETIEARDAAHRFDLNLSWQALEFLAVELALDSVTYWYRVVPKATSGAELCGTDAAERTPQGRRR